MKKNTEMKNASMAADSLDMKLYRGFVGSAYGFSGTMLKTFAIIIMVLDHTGAAVVYPILRRLSITANRELYGQLKYLYSLMRGIGRLAFPIFCFFIVEGFFHTKNRMLYAYRLFLFALLSEFPFDYCLKPGYIYWQKQNVYFTLLIGLLVIWMMDLVRQRPCLQYLCLAAGLMLSRAMMTDYNYKGVFLIAVLYLLHEHRFYECAGGAAAIAWESWAPLSFILCFFYNGKRGRGFKYLFYCFYPGHLLILGTIRHYLIPMLLPR